MCLRDLRHVPKLKPIISTRFRDGSAPIWVCQEVPRSCLLGDIFGAANFTTVPREATETMGLHLEGRSSCSILGTAFPAPDTTGSRNTYAAPPNL